MIMKFKFTSRVEVSNMNLIEMLVIADKHGLFYLDSEFLVNLTKNYIDLGYRVNRNELAINYICLIMDSNFNLNNIITNHDFIDFLESKRKEFSEPFINKLLSILKYEVQTESYESLDIDEELYLKRFESILGFEVTLDYDVYQELIRIMDLAIENLEFMLSDIIDEMER